MANHISHILSQVQSQSPLVVKGLDNHTLPYFAQLTAKQTKSLVLLVANNHSELSQFITDLSFFAPKAKVLPFPAWDVQPYDRLSADNEIQSQRMRTLAELNAITGPTIVVTTPAALSIRIPPKSGGVLNISLKVGQVIDRSSLIRQLEAAGYHRVSTVMDASEFAVRGALIDLFPSGEKAPVRLDFFDDELERIHTFDPLTQRSTGELDTLQLTTASEVVLSDDAIKNFRLQYRSLFPQGMDDAIYKDISAGIPHPAMGHYLPLFHDKPLESFFDRLPKNTTLVTNAMFEGAVIARHEQTQDAFEVRKTPMDIDLDENLNEPYRPIAPETLYLGPAQIEAACKKYAWIKSADIAEQNKADVDIGMVGHLSYRAQIEPGQSIIAKLAQDIKKARGKHSIVLSMFTPSALEKVQKGLEENGIYELIKLSKWADIESKKDGLYGTVSPLSWGFVDSHGHHVVYTEQDLFGEKQNQVVKRRKRKEDVISHFSELGEGDFVVHHDHGIGRFIGLQTLNAGGAEQDYVTIEYDGGDKLYVPVVSLDVLSRHSAGEESVRTDKLGGSGWQARKARVKEKLFKIAGKLIEIAANRKLKKRPPYQKPAGLYDEFVEGFPFVPTAEQKQAIDDVEVDMTTKDMPMDRLVVGDVGFGKTEVAMRAAFIAAADGRQVAVVVPTTLLARQHFNQFKLRFQGVALKVGVLSRLSTPAQIRETKAALKKGEIDIIVGTHALLAKDVDFLNLGLVIIDEEQRFGVQHKERLKELRNMVDVLTLTATPIPRTLQMSISGLRELSMITTPPVDRLAVRTFVMGFDSKSLREAILREIYRGGQTYVVTPRVEGIEKLAKGLQEIVPEAKVRVAHGQMPKGELDDVMTDFYDNQFNVLISTTIIESGIDVPRANTMIIHQANRFGLAQLYQLRGRVGRSKARAYAYLLLPKGGRMTDEAYKRIQVLQKLDTLGAGFMLASYDLDIRGPGNIVGEEQSGHIKEVGYELYNQMLRETIDELKQGGVQAQASHESWSPILNLGFTYRLPEDYVPDVGVRMQLYRRLSHVVDLDEVDNLHDEIRDRFGPMPPEVSALIDVVKIRNRAKACGIERIDVGEKGATVAFRSATFENPQGLLHYILENPGIMSLRPDQKITIHRRWPDAKSRVEGLGNFLADLEKIKN